MFQLLIFPEPVALDTEEEIDYYHNQLQSFTNVWKNSQFEHDQMEIVFDSMYDLCELTAENNQVRGEFEDAFHISVFSDLFSGTSVNSYDFGKIVLDILGITDEEDTNE